MRVYSRRWEVLKTGAVLVDAPGVHDDNSARDGVVKRKLKEADAVWIVSNIVRAVNDKTAKDLLGEQFRRQMLMDGQYGALAFVATQSDVLERSEALRSLRLPEKATLRECAEARNEYTRRRLKQDFHAGLKEMVCTPCRPPAPCQPGPCQPGRPPPPSASTLRPRPPPSALGLHPPPSASTPQARRAQAEEAGDDGFRAEAFQLPVFTVSALEYQKLKGLRPTDGRARVWSHVEQTRVPALVRHVQHAALARRKAITTRRCEAMRDCALGVKALLEQERQLPQETRDAAKGAYEALALGLASSLRASAQAAEAKVQSSFDTQVAPQLEAGAEAARTDALATTAQWGISVTQGGLHWATYKATTRRHGVFRINMNEARPRRAHLPSLGP